MTTLFKYINLNLDHTVSYGGWHSLGTEVSPVTFYVSRKKSIVTWKEDEEYVLAIF